jgi:hypothetical protein
MRRWGITPVDAESAGVESELATAREHCRNCESTAACRRWLAFGVTRRFAKHCRNRELFDSILFDKKLRQQDKK